MNCRGCGEEVTARLGKPGFIDECDSCALKGRDKLLAMVLSEDQAKRAGRLRAEGPPVDWRETSGKRGRKPQDRRS